MSPLLSIVRGKRNLAPASENDRIKRYCEWIRDRLLVRADAYVTYDWRGKKFSPLDWEGDPTKKKPLTPKDIIKHVEGVQPLCLYALGQPGTAHEGKSKWLAWDLDNHEGDGETSLRNTDYALYLTDVLRSGLGLDPMVESSDGRGGYHVWVLFDDLLPSAVAHRLAQWVIEVKCDWRQFLKQPPESFPKQAFLTATRRYGSSVRVPGRHPTRNTWSAVLARDGDRWITWPDAIDEIISYTGDPADLIPGEVRSYGAQQQRACSQPKRHHRHDPGVERLVTSVADLFDLNKTWESVLEPHGWEIVQMAGEVKYWRRPGKWEPGHSATTGYTGDKMFVFSNNAKPFEGGRPYSKFQAFAILEHGGDHNAAEAYIVSNLYDGGI